MNQKNAFKHDSFPKFADRNRPRPYSLPTFDSTRLGCETMPDVPMMLEEPLEPHGRTGPIRRPDTGAFGRTSTQF